MPTADRYIRRLAGLTETDWSVIAAARGRRFRDITPAMVLDDETLDDGVRLGWFKTKWIQHAATPYIRRYAEQHGQEAVTAYFRQHRRMPPEISEPVRAVQNDTAAYRDFIREGMEEKFDRVRAELAGHVHGGHIRVFRWVRVPPDWFTTVPRGASLGIFWTFVEGSYQPNPATRNNGQPDWVPVTVEALVDETTVNWVQTFHCNMGIDDGIGLGWEKEKEIRMFKDSPLRIVEVRRDDGQPVTMRHTSFRA